MEKTYQDSGVSNLQEKVDQLLSLLEQKMFCELASQAEQLSVQYPNTPDIWNILGIAHKELGFLDNAILAFNKALELNANYPDPYNNLGVALHAQGKLPEAVEAFNKALALKPDFSHAYNNIGNVYKDLGNFDHAMVALNNAVSNQPNYAEPHYTIGTILQEQGKLEPAILAFQKAISLKPDYVRAHYNLGISLKLYGDTENAIDALNIARALQPDNPEIHFFIGTVLADQNKFIEAVEAFEKALKVKPEVAEWSNFLGTSFRALGMFDRACEAFNNAIRIKPDFALAHNNLAAIFQDQGKLSDAKRSYKNALMFNPKFAVAHRNLSTLTKYGKGMPQIGEVEVLLQNADLNDDDRCNLLYALAKMNEDLENFALAFQSFVEGGRIRKKLLGYNFNQDLILFERIKQTASTIISQKFNPKIKEKSLTPVFILGMPRSGTTLIEQIVSCHSKVEAGGELSFVKDLGGAITFGYTPVTFKALKDFRNTYLEQLSQLSKGRQFVIDKMPSNFLHIGLLLKTFPEAKIIHVKRDPAATCWSNFKTYFSVQGLGYSYNLEDTVMFFKMYTELMKIWGDLFPSNIYNLDYEALTVSQEDETRRLLEYLELDWEVQCLSPHANRREINTASQLQVREKIYTGSSKAWLNYQPYLKGVFDIFSS